MPSILLFVDICFPDLAIGNIVFSRQIPFIGRYGAGILFQQVLALKCFASINRCSFTCVIPCVRIVLVFVYQTHNSQFVNKKKIYNIIKKTLSTHYYLVYYIIFVKNMLVLYLLF